MLLYVKGGAAVDRRHTIIGFSPATVVRHRQAIETRWGGTVGAGLEFGFAPNWSAARRIRPSVHGHAYRPFDFFGRRAIFARDDRIRQDVDIVTVRVNYRWGGPVIAKY